MEEEKVVEEVAAVENPKPAENSAAERVATAAAVAASEKDKDAEIARLKGELEVLRDEVSKERARNLIDRAKAEGKLTPAMVAEGSPWVEMAYHHPDLFVRCVDTLPRQMAQDMKRIEIANEDRRISGSRARELAQRIMEQEGLDFAAAYDAVFARRLLED